MNDNVVSLAGARVGEPQFNPNQKDIVEALEQLLADARAGHIHVFCGAMVDGHGRGWNIRHGFIADNTAAFSLLGGLSQLSYAVQKQVTEIMEEEDGYE